MTLSRQEYMKLKIRHFSIALMLCAGCAAWGSPDHGNANSTSLITKSDSIFIGKVTGRERTPAGIENLRIEVEKLLGAPSGHRVGESINLHLGEYQAAWVPLGDHRLFFLQCDALNRFSCKATNDNAVSLPVNLSATTQDGLELTNAVIAELIGVVGADDADLGRGIGRSEIPPATANYTRADALTALLTLPRAKVIAALAGTSTPYAPAPQLAMTGLQIAMGDVSSMDRVTPLVLKPTQDIQDSVALVVQGLYFLRPKPASMVPTLAKWLRSPDSSLRLSTAVALRAIGTPEVVRPMLELGLNDTDQNIRCQAVETLAAVTRLDDVVSIELYNSNEAKYLKFWKSRQAGLEAQYK